MHLPRKPVNNASKLTLPDFFRSVFYQDPDGHLKQHQRTVLRTVANPPVLTDRPRHRRDFGTEEVGCLVRSRLIGEIFEKPRWNTFGS